MLVCLAWSWVLQRISDLQQVVRYCWTTVAIMIVGVFVIDAMVSQVANN